QVQHAKDTFLDNALVHFRDAVFTVFKDDGNFFDGKAQLPGSELHFDLESIADKAYLIEVDRLQYFFTVADAPCRRVLHRHPGNQAGIDRAAPGEQDPVSGPVDITSAF